MSTEIIVSLIGAVATIIGVCITVVVSNKTTRQQLKDQNNLTLYRIDQLEKKVHEHNNLVERTYALERRVAILEADNNDGK